ncbi:MAG: hypothetical protein WED83_09635 [Acidimicrobiia bacterium]
MWSRFVSQINRARTRKRHLPVHPDEVVGKDRKALGGQVCKQGAFATFTISQQSPGLATIYEGATVETL